MIWNNTWSFILIMSNRNSDILNNNNSILNEYNKGGTQFKYNLEN